MTFFVMAENKRLLLANSIEPSRYFNRVKILLYLVGFRNVFTETWGVRCLKYITFQNAVVIQRVQYPTINKNMFPNANINTNMFPRTIINTNTINIIPLSIQTFSLTYHQQYKHVTRHTVINTNMFFDMPS